MVLFKRAPFARTKYSMDSASPPSDSSDSKAPIHNSQRASEHLAAERTFLAWIRTSVSIISLGFVVAKFGLWLRELSEQLGPGMMNIHKSSASLPIGIGLMAIGGALALLALWHFHDVNLKIEQGEVRANRGLVVTVAITVAALSVLVIIYLLCTAQSG
jgi:putative membrane protein